MRRKLIAVIAGGAVAGAASALIAYAALADHPATASDQGQPSTLLEFAASNGGGTLATAPSWPGQTTGSDGGGSSSAPAGRSQQGGGSVVAHGVSPTPPPFSGGDTGTGTGSTGSNGSTGGQASSAATPTPSGDTGLPTLPAVWLPSSTPTPAPTPTATATPAHATATPTPSGGGQVSVQVPPLPLPLPSLPPICVLLICIKP